MVDGLLSDGFALDNHNWNSYITYLAIRHKYQLGFRLCETYLMDKWTGWARIRWTLPVRNRLSTELRAERKNPKYLRPKYLTILHLARGYLELQSMAAESRHSEALLADLEAECPRVVKAITTMQRVDDHLERTILRGH
jgi:pentatricopeptide repeat-containing protein PET309